MHLFAYSVVVGILAAFGMAAVSVLRRQQPAGSSPAAAPWRWWLALGVRVVSYACLMVVITYASIVVLYVLGSILPDPWLFLAWIVPVLLCLGSALGLYNMLQKF